MKKVLALMWAAALLPAFGQGNAEEMLAKATRYAEAKNYHEAVMWCRKAAD